MNEKQNDFLNFRLSVMLLYKTTRLATLKMFLDVKKMLLLFAIIALVFSLYAMVVLREFTVLPALAFMAYGILKFDDNIEKNTLALAKKCDIKEIYSIPFFATLSQVEKAKIIVALEQCAVSEVKIDIVKFLQMLNFTLDEIHDTAKLKNTEIKPF